MTNPDDDTANHTTTRTDGEPPGRILSVHMGHSANCSSIGSVIDFLFVSSVAAASTLAALSVLVGAARTDIALGDDAEKPESSLGVDAETEDAE